MIRIEEVTKRNLSEAADQELRSLRYKFATYWDRHFKHNTKDVVGCFNRSGFVAKYRLLLKEMDSPQRSLERSTCDIDRQAFRQSMEAREDGIDLALFSEIVTGKNCVILDENFAKADEINITVQQDSTEPDEWLEKEITKVFKEQFDRPCVFNYEQNYEGSGIPLFHKILRPVVKLEKVSIKGDEEGEEIEKDIVIVPVKKGDQHICYGIVYEPDTVDAQGDSANAEEIKKAAYDFMEHVQTFKVMHKGKKVNIKILENYIAPVDFTIAKKTVKKGSWVLVTRVLDSKVWKDIKAGKLTGYSMAGYAKVD